MSETIETIETRNLKWGFWGAWSDRGAGIPAADAWTGAVNAVLEKQPASTPEEARDFLDSRMGRHYADQVVDQLLIADRQGFDRPTLADALRDKLSEFLAWYGQVK